MKKNQVDADDDVELETAPESDTEVVSEIVQRVTSVKSKPKAPTTRPLKSKSTHQAAVQEPGTKTVAKNSKESQGSAPVIRTALERKEEIQRVLNESKQLRSNREKFSSANKQKHVEEKKEAEVLIRQLLADANNLVVFTDGSCKPNPGFGGSACCLVRPSSTPLPFQETEEGADSELAGGSVVAQEELETVFQSTSIQGMTTNNITELTAIQMALVLLSKEPDARSCWHILTDSNYSVGALANGNRANKNVELIESILNLQQLLVDKHQVTLQYHWIPSHVGINYNEKVDQSAKAAGYQAYRDSLKSNKTNQTQKTTSRTAKATGSKVVKPVKPQKPQETQVEPDDADVEKVVENQSIVKAAVNVRPLGRHVTKPADIRLLRRALPKETENATMLDYDEYATELMDQLANEQDDVPDPMPIMPKVLVQKRKPSSQETGATVLTKRIKH